MRKMRNTMWAFNAIRFVVILLIVAVVVLYAIMPYSTVDTVTFTVTGKERVTTCGDGDCSGKYLVFTDIEVFENTDSLAYMKFNSSDVYGKLEIGGTYTAKVYGFRAPFFSMYRNIVQIESENK